MTGAVVQAVSNFLLALAAFFTQLGMKIGREQEREKIQKKTTCRTIFKSIFCMAWSPEWNCSDPFRRHSRMFGLWRWRLKSAFLSR
jgi:hypothetical protein